MIYIYCWRCCSALLFGEGFMCTNLIENYTINIFFFFYQFFKKSNTSVWFYVGRFTTKRLGTNVGMECDYVEKSCHYYDYSLVSKFSSKLSTHTCVNYYVYVKRFFIHLFFLHFTIIFFYLLKIFFLHIKYVADIY